MPIIEAEGLTKLFQTKRGLLGNGRGLVRAVDGISFTIETGRTLGVVGESGCGKSTAGRVILRLLKPSSGQVLFHGQDVASVDGKALQALRRRMQIIFQDPFSSLNPRRTVGSIVGQPLQIHNLATGKEIPERVADILGRVGLNPAHANR